MWGYNEVKVENHPKTRRNGWVLEHVYEAELMLGRPLKDGEVVHHIDENRRNNSHSNLMVFKTSSDHSRFHKTGICVKLDDGAYIAPAIEKEMKKCKICEKECLSDYCSQKCCGISQRKSERPNKEVLLQQVSELGYVGTGRLYGVTDNAIRKWIKRGD